MGIFDFLSRKPKAAPAAVNTDLDDPGWTFAKAMPAADVLALPSSTGFIRNSRAPRRGTLELLLAYEHMPYLQTVIRKISTNAASVPLRAFTRTRGKARNPDSKAIRDRGAQGAGVVEKAARLKGLRQTGELREILDHPLLDLLANPGNGMHGRTLLQMTFAWLDLVGEAFWIYLTNPAGMPISVMACPPHWIRELPTRSAPFFRVQIDALTYEVPIDNMVWFKDPSLANPYGRGAGTGMSLADDLDVDENAAKHVSSFFYNRAMPDMIVSVKDGDETVLKAVKAKFENDHRGLTAAHRSAFLNGEVSVQRLDTTFQEMDLINLRKFSGRDVVIQSFGVSPEMLGILDNSNRATISEARGMFAENVLIPRLDLVSTVLQTFAELFDERLIVAFDDPTPANNEFALKVAQARPGSRTDNEWRALQGLEPVDGGDVYRVSATEIVVDRLDVGLVDKAGESARAEAAATENAVQDSAMNGAQATALSAIAVLVAEGKIPKLSAIAQILALFPSIDEAQAHAIIDPIVEGSAKPEPPPPGPGPGGNGAPKPPAAKAAAPAANVLDVSTKTLDEGGVENILEALRPERLTLATFPVVEDTILAMGSAEAALVGAGGTFNMLNPLVTTYLRDYSTQKIKGLVDGTTRDALRATLVQGTQAGESIPKIAQRVRDVFTDADTRRSKVIARTEVVGAANRGTYAAHVMSGVVQRRQWVGTPSVPNRSRDTHKVGSMLYGQVCAIGEKFTSGSGAQALHPGGFGVAGEDISCRCTTIALVGIEPRSANELEIEQRDFEARISPYEERYERAIRGGFRAQESDVLAALAMAAI